MKLVLSNFVLFLLVTVVTSAQESPPNIILIMADDMGWSDVGCYGGEIPTPNIDRLANEGMLLTSFYNNGKCTTTRASLLTGLYSRKGGRGQELLSDEMVTLGEALRKKGYHTGLSGKWHNGNKAPHRPIDRGFDKSYGLWDGCCNFFDPSIQDPEFKGSRMRFFGEDDVQITKFPEDFFTTDAFTDHAIETIRSQMKTGKPFFHYLPYTAPHYPIHAKPEDIEKFDGDYEGGWDELRKTRYERQVEMGLVDPKVFPLPGPNKVNTGWDKREPKAPEWQQLRMEAYAAMVFDMDRNIGRLLDELAALGVEDNTMVIFLSDNGACAETPGGNDTEQIPGPKEYYSHVGPNWAYAQNTPFRSFKSNTYEGGIATPCVIRWPDKVKPGTKSDALGHIIDFLPTFLEVAGGSYEEMGDDLIPVEGVSLVGLMTELDEPKRTEPLFWLWAGNRAVREGEWKAVFPKSGDGWELYNLSTNRTETVDLSGEEKERTERMAAAWDVWATKTGVRK